VLVNEVRIQILPMLGHVVVVVAELDSFGGRQSRTVRMYTFSEDDYDHGGLVELLGLLQRTMGESEG
jgi:hypothetical protein